MKGEVRLGYYVDWDTNSYTSFEEHAASLTHVAPEWFTLVDTDSRLVTDPDQRLATFAASRNVVLMPLLQNLQGNVWHP